MPTAPTPTTEPAPEAHTAPGPLLTAPRADAANLARGRWWLVGAILFPLAVWAACTLYLGGNVGKISDDWSLSLRDVVTGEAERPFNPWKQYPYYWRPLHIAMIFTVGTFAFDDVRPVGVFVACMHLWAGVSLYRLARLGTRSWAAPAMASTLWLAHPMHYEVSLWFSSTCTAIASAIAFTLMRWQARAVLDEPATPGRARDLRLGLAAFILGLCVSGFYEQPAAGLAVMPFILAGVWLSRPGARRPARRELRRAAIVVGGAWASNIAYGVLLVLTAPQGARGGEKSFVSSDVLAQRLASVAHSVWWHAGGNRLRELTLGSFKAGLRELDNAAGVAIISGLVALAASWALLMILVPGERPAPRAQQPHAPSSASTPSSASAPARVPASPRSAAGARVLWTLTGIGMIVAGMLPVAMLARQNVEPRTMYFPLAGAAIVLSQLLDLLMSAGPGTVRSRSAPHARARSPLALVAIGARCLIAPAGAAVCVLACICAVGIQTAVHARSAGDARLFSTLSRLVPSPPKDAVFVPVEVLRPLDATGYLAFDEIRPSALSAVWAGREMLQRTYRRRDIDLVPSSPWVPPFITRADAHGLYADRLTDRFRDGFIARERIVPFVVNRRGDIVLVSRVKVETPDGVVSVVEAPAVEALRPGLHKDEVTNARIKAGRR